MPIELPDLPNEDDAPPAPSALVWVAFLAVCIVSGVGWTFLTTSAAQRTEAPSIWLVTTGLPLLAWVTLFGLRLHAHEASRRAFDAWTDLAKADREQAIAFGAEPLAVLDVACWTALGEKGVAAQITAKTSALQARMTLAGGAPVRHARLDVAGEGDPLARAQAVVPLIVERMAAAVRTLPKSLPLKVRLLLPFDKSTSEDVGATWELCWHAAGLRPMEASIEPLADGVMMLDRWLDTYGGAELEKCALLVAIQLQDVAPANSGEAAVAILLGWAPAVLRSDLTPIAMVHRPVEADMDELADAIRLAGICGGRAVPQDLQHLWECGLTDADKSALLAIGPDTGLGALESDGFANVHDIDAALGHPGLTTPWLAIAMAVEHAAETDTSQLVACRENGLRLAVVRPAGNALEEVSSR